MNPWRGRKQKLILKWPFAFWFHRCGFIILHLCSVVVWRCNKTCLRGAPPLDFSQHSTRPHPIFLLRKYPKETGTISSRVSSCLPLNSLSLFSLCNFKAEYRLMLESYLRVGKHFPPTSITDRFTLRLETPLSLRLRVSRETHQHLLSLLMRSWQEVLPKVSLLLRFCSQITTFL